MGVLQDFFELRKERRWHRRFGHEWHDRNKLAPPSAEPLVIFVIPLISRARAANWHQVVANLSATLDSLRRQTDARWQAIVCCQDQPAGIAFDDSVHFLRFPIAAKPPEGKKLNLDKGRKKDHALCWVSETFPGDGYVFILDADDILHPRLVEYIVGDNNGSGYLIDRGYMYDASSHRIAPLQPSMRQNLGGKRSFYRECGSCAALRFDFRHGPECLEVLRLKGGHKRLKLQMADIGFPLAPVPFHAGLYAVNHGENLRQVRGKLGSKMAYLDRHRLPPHEAEAVRREFGLLAQG